MSMFVLYNIFLKTKISGSFHDSFLSGSNGIVLELETFIININYLIVYTMTTEFQLTIIGSTSIIKSNFDIKKFTKLILTRSFNFIFRILHSCF